jgi:hypothetical protein
MTKLALIVVLLLFGGGSVAAYHTFHGGSANHAKPQCKAR